MTTTSEQPADPTVVTDSPVSASPRRSGLELATWLLRPERSNAVLESIELAHTPESIGALDGLSWRDTEYDVTIAVYLFDTWGNQPEAIEILQASAPTEDAGYRVLFGTNGYLLFFGYTQINGENGIYAKYRLSGLVSAFSGDE